MYGRSAVYVCAAEYITTKKYIAKFYVCESKRPYPYPLLISLLSRSRVAEVMAAAVAVAMEAVVAVDMESEKAELSALSHDIPFVNFCQKIIIIIIVIIVTTNTIIMIIVSITIAFMYLPSQMAFAILSSIFRPLLPFNNRIFVEKSTMSTS
jgi:hypothetical protein